MTSDFVEGNGVLRRGHTVLDNVEIYNCSQYDTYKAALRFEGAHANFSHVSNSAIHHGLGWGFHINTASNITFENNVFFGFSLFGG